MIADFVIKWYWQNPQSLSCQQNIKLLNYNSLYAIFNGKENFPLTSHLFNQIRKNINLVEYCPRYTEYLLLILHWRRYSTYTVISKILNRGSKPQRHEAPYPIYPEWRTNKHRCSVKAAPAKLPPVATKYAEAVARSVIRRTGGNNLPTMSV